MSIDTPSRSTTRPAGGRQRQQTKPRKVVAHCPQKSDSSTAASQPPWPMARAGVADPGSTAQLAGSCLVPVKSAWSVVRTDVSPIGLKLSECGIVSTCVPARTDVFGLKPDADPKDMFSALFQTPVSLAPPSCPVTATVRAALAHPNKPKEPRTMDTRFAKLIAILVVMAVGYSVLSTPGRGFDVDVGQLKAFLVYILLGAGAYAIYLTFRSRRPPGV